MTDQPTDPPLEQRLSPSDLPRLSKAFPLIQTVPLSQHILTSPHLPKLARLIQLSIPLHAYSPELITLHELITSHYYLHTLRISEHRQTEDSPNQEDQAMPSNQLSQQTQHPQIEAREGKRKERINYLELASYISQFGAEEESDVSQELIEMGKTFSHWKVKEVAVADQKSKTQYGHQTQYNHQQHQQGRTPRKESFERVKQKANEATIGKDKVESNPVVSIIMGRNITLESQQMRTEIISRANNNKFLEENPEMPELDKIGIEINYILNRITEEYFEDFLKELRPYAKHQAYSLVLADKIIEKVMEEHNYINIYCKLVKRLKGATVAIPADKSRQAEVEGDKSIKVESLKFKSIVVERLQEQFNLLVRKGEWQEKEELYKKMLIGMSTFVGQLLRLRFLSKYIFCDIFYELMRSYVMQYQKHKEDKSLMYYETFVECAIKIIENMGDYYEQLQLKKNTSDTQAVIRQLFESGNSEDANFPHICDFVEVLVQLNRMMPSHRFKITFLLEDFKCSKRLKKERDNLDNIEYQLMKDVLSIDPSNPAATSRIPGMLEQGDSQTLMKDYLFQFAQGTSKQVNRNIELFTVMAACPGICDALLSAFKQNLQALFLIETDFPFMGKGLAGIMKTVCERKELNYQELKLGEEDHEDEDIRWFLQGIEAKYYKMIMQD